jgi:hypothetical protein
MRLHRLFYDLLGIHQMSTDEILDEVNAYDMSQPVDRPGERQQYTLPDRTLLTQMRAVINSEVIRD